MQNIAFMTRHVYIMRDNFWNTVICGKKDQEEFWENRVILRNNCLKFTHFSSNIMAKFIASNIASINLAKRLRYPNRISLKMP